MPAKSSIKKVAPTRLEDDKKQRFLDEPFEWLESVHTTGKTPEGHPVSSWIVKAVNRHFADLKRTDEVKFSREKADHALLWINRNATITEDGIAVRTGERLKLRPWQRALIAILFGWRRTDGTRRFRMIYAELARGNGKSKLASAIALYVLIGEGVRGSAVFSIATTMEQAKMVFDDAALMAANSGKRPDLTKLKQNKNLLFVPGTATVFRPLASNEHNLDGLKPNLIVVDELHAHRSRGPWNKCKTALGKKPGSMMLAITTAGFDRHSVCYEQRTYAEKVLDGHPDDSYLAWIAALDKDDDPFDKENWHKSNLNLGFSIELQTIEDAAMQAQLIPTEYNDFLRLRCNIWTESSTLWMHMDKWDLCGTKVLRLEDLAGRPAFMGVDLSSVADVTAVVLIFPPFGDDPKWHVLPFFFMPEDNVRERVKNDKVPYDAWIRNGFMLTTRGATINYEQIREHIVKLADKYDIQQVGFDPWSAHQLAGQLSEDGLLMVPVRQGFPSMNAPMRDLMVKVLNHEIEHYKHPVLRWMVSNTVADIDEGAGLIKPDKKKSSEKIDGLVALVNALARAIVTPLKVKKESTWTPTVWG